MKELLEKSRKLLKEAIQILVFSGAGLSTESGIPDFRSPGGIWTKYDPAEFYYDRIVSDPKARVKYWKMSSQMYATIKDARPNAAHLAIRSLEEQGKLRAVVTQNIDRLHHKAGNSPKKIIEIHGSVFSVSCLSCGKRYERDLIEQRLKEGDTDPACDDCAGVLKPETISFGQAMPRDKMALAFQHARACDLCIVLGSSLVVYPAASIPVEAADSGTALIIVNREETPIDYLARVVIHDSVCEVMKAIIN